MTELKTITFFGHIHPFEFFVLMNLFNFYFFGHIHQFFGKVQRLMFVGVIFRSRSIVHVRQCEFHLVIFKPNFGHIESVKITSLVQTFKIINPLFLDNIVKSVWHVLLK